MPMGETGTRVAVAAVGIPLAVGAVYLGGWALGLLLAGVAALAARELYSMAELKGARPLVWPGAAGAAGFVLLALLFGDSSPEPAGLGVYAAVFTILVAAAAIWTRGVEGQPLLSTAVTVFGAVYTGGLLSYGVLLRHLPEVTGPLHGAALLFAPILLTWSSDTFAYFVGRAFGRRKLIPKVSPGKTVEGAAGAVVGTIVVAVAYAQVLQQFPGLSMGVPMAALFGLVISVAAQLGDLAESLLKRDAGVKDSGRLLPGHGGALDRFDSLLFTLPIAYLFFRYGVGG
jgi:phosphatidate cytidylyltransferase